jgi:hypothetical protein
MITAPILSMLVIPAAYLLLRRRGLARTTAASRHPHAAGSGPVPAAAAATTPR